MEINMLQVEGPSYPINTNKKLQIAENKLKAYVPVLIGKDWRVSEDLVTEIEFDWLQGKKPTLILVRARQSVVDDWRRELKAAIARVEQELRDGI